MNISQKHLVAVLLGAVLIGSGCTIGGGGKTDSEKQSTTSPIQVQEFSAFPNPAPESNKVTFTLTMKNTGEVTAENVKAKLWNPPFANTAQDEATWRSENGGRVRQSDITYDFGKLQGTESGVDPFPKTEEIRLTAPNLREGDAWSYQFNAEIRYEYTTQGSTSLTAMNSETFQESSQERTTNIDIPTNSAPITLSGRIRTGNPIVFYQDENGPKNAVLCIDVKNKGSGTVYSPEASTGNSYNLQDSYENKLDLTVEVVGSTRVSAEGNSFSKTAEKEVSLVDGDQARPCFTLEVSPPTQGSQKTIGPISVTADYVYTKDSSTTVTVNGRANN
ncbi:MAG: hypothetical protein ABEJ93_01075 [Candidatus Nanohalobium sp.]